MSNNFMPTLTKKQKELMDYITKYINQNGVPPTIEEMAGHFKKAVGTIHEHLEGLINKGLIKRSNGARDIEIISHNELVTIPLRGYIAAGYPIEAIEEYETITIPKNLLSKTGEHFALKVKGESMINDGVFDGDNVIIRKQSSAEDNDMVVALINGEEATLKRFFQEKNRIRLQPANPNFKPIFTKNPIIQGKVVSVIRNFNSQPNDEFVDFTNLTSDYIKEADLKYRKKLGQYFTPKPIREALIAQLPNNIKNPKVLDPGCGTGEFLLTAKKYFTNPELHGWDIDEKLVDISKKNSPGAFIKCMDSLNNDNYNSFDFVIGNPPYFEFIPSKELKHKFKEIINGRVNIFSLFVYQGLKWLKEGGYLAYVIPPSMNNGAYFSKLREFIINNSNIEYIKVLNDPKLFHGAQQTTMLLILRKGKNKGNYVFKKNGITIFTEDVDYLENSFKNKVTLFDLGYRVKTGRIIWNENKKILTNDKKNNIPLVWSQNITETGFELFKDEKKPQYIKKDNPDIGPAIVVNRITGTVKTSKLKSAVIPSGFKFFAENHVNVITPPKNNKQEQLLPNKKLSKIKAISLNEIARQLSSQEKLRVVRSITGNTQISKTELEKLFPISLN